MQQQLASAWMAADRVALERIVASDWTLTGTDGRLSTRVDVLHHARCRVWAGEHGEEAEAAEVSTRRNGGPEDNGEDGA